MSDVSLNKRIIEDEYGIRLKEDNKVYSVVRRQVGVGGRHVAYRITDERGGPIIEGSRKYNQIVEEIEKHRRRGR